MGPAVSAVVLSRGDAVSLVTAVRSVLRQRCDLEVLVVLETGHDDAVARMVHGWGEPRVRLLSPDTPAGAAVARNLGAEHAAARVIAFLDASDVWFGHKLQAQLAALEASGSSWCFGSALLFSGEMTLEALLPAPTAAAAVERLPSANAVPGGGSNVVVTRDALQAVGGFDPTVPHLEDWDLWIRLAQQQPPAVVDTTVVACRHGAAMNHRRLTELLSSARTLDDRYRSLRGGRPLDWADLHRWLCHDALRFGPRSVALRLAAGSVRQQHAGRADLALRSLLPVRRRPPVRSRDEATGLLDRRFPPRVVRWPAGTETELTSLLASGGAVR